MLKSDGQTKPNIEISKYLCYVSNPPTVSDNPVVTALGVGAVANNRNRVAKLLGGGGQEYLKKDVDES